jgi:adenosylhomocysteine nucleosidase
MIGVICPSQFEYRALDRKKLSRQGTVLICPGMGKVRTVIGCAKLLKDYPKLRFILLIGFAGGLTKNLQIGDVVEPRTFIEQDYNAEPFEKFPNKIRRKNARAYFKGSKNAVMLTQDRFLTSNPYQDGPYAKKYKTLTCDMESYAVAQFCKNFKLDYAVIKLISDVADENADHDFLKACRKLAPKLNRVVLKAIKSL